MCISFYFGMLHGGQGETVLYEGYGNHFYFVWHHPPHQNHQFPLRKGHLRSSSVRHTLATTTHEFRPIYEGNNLPVPSLRNNGTRFVVVKLSGSHELH
ncbi:hypothetical protein HanIR_Chr14g0722701 [Helianthus annuus]|nr:hypothetical protein HanIR_Chr14g0722701 [Helianthus annuus]